MLDCRKEETVHALYQQVGRPILFKLQNIVKRQDVSQELLQETFLKLWQSRMQFPTEKAAFAWLYKTSHHQAIDYLRKHAHRFESGEETIDEIAKTPTDHNPLEERVINLDVVRKALQHLNQKETEMLVYSAVEGMTKVEIAELCGVSRKTITRTFAKIEETLRKRLGVQYEAA